MGYGKCTVPCRKGERVLGRDVPVAASAAPETDHVDFGDKFPFVKADGA
jgi:hypothetical protein